MATGMDPLRVWSTRILEAGLVSWIWSPSMRPLERELHAHSLRFDVSRFHLYLVHEIDQLFMFTIRIVNDIVLRLHVRNHVGRSHDITAQPLASSTAFNRES